MCDIKTMCNSQEKICIFTGREPGEIRFGWEERWYGHPWDQIRRLSLFCPACGHWTLAHISDRKLQQTEGKFVTTTGKLNKLVNSFTRWKNQGTLWNCNFKDMQKPFLGRFVLYFFGENEKMCFGPAGRFASRRSYGWWTHPLSLSEGGVTCCLFNSKLRPSRRTVC